MFSFNEPDPQSARSSQPVEPTRNPDVTLADLVTVLLDKGTYLNIVLIISVADVPVIGVNLRATLAGMETMLKYGMMRDWDEKTRRWVRQPVARHFPLADREEIVAKTACGHFQQDFAETWRPGGLYLTNQRLVVFRRDPKEVLWSSSRDRNRQAQGVYLSSVTLMRWVAVRGVPATSIKCSSWSGPRVTHCSGWR